MLTSSVASTQLKLALAASIFPVLYEIHSLYVQPIRVQVERSEQPAIVDVENAQRQIPVSADGLYRVNAKLNGRNVRFVVDSGANTTILTQADARGLGLKPKKMHFRRKIVTANGEASLATVAIPSVKIAGKNFEHVPVAVIGNKGGVSLMGQDMIARLDGVSINDGVMTLRGAESKGGEGITEKDTGEKVTDAKSASGEAVSEKGATEKATDGKNAGEKEVTTPRAVSPPARAPRP